MALIIVRVSEKFCDKFCGIFVRNYQNIINHGVIGENQY